MKLTTRRNALLAGLLLALLGIPALLALGGRGPAIGSNGPSASPSSGPQATGASTPNPTGSQIPNFSHVFLIVMENREYGTVMGNPATPYINSLAHSYGVATNYYAITHPSLPNYLALAAGSTFGITSDCTDCFVKGANIGDQVEGSGRSWKAYMEDMPTNCYLGAFHGGYAIKHNPFVYFSELRNDSSRCAAHVVPFTNFSSDLAAGATPDFSWITPNLCNDMHDCSAAIGDRWLNRVVPQILGSQAWRDGGVLFITFDEGSSGKGCCTVAAGGQIVTLVISPQGKPGYVSKVAHTHYGLLRTIEDAWHLGELDNAGCSCSQPLFEFF